tara:strand:+ start:15108 stop:15356 length:249 start_codon:yes stop_codon:yes gene_type:complete
MTRLEEINFIIEGLEKEKGNIIKGLRKFEGLLLSGSKAAVRNQMLERETVIDSELIKYVEEEKDIKWSNSINSIENWTDELS